MSVCVCVIGGGGQGSSKSNDAFTDLLQYITSLDLIHFGVKHDLGSYKEK